MSASVPGVFGAQNFSPGVCGALTIPPGVSGALIPISTGICGALTTSPGVSGALTIPPGVSDALIPISPGVSGALNASPGVSDALISISSSVPDALTISPGVSDALTLSSNASGVLTIPPGVPDALTFVPGTSDTSMSICPPLSNHVDVTVRPNASLLFTGANPPERSGNMLSTSLCSSSIRQVLQDYPDQSFTDLLCDIADYGAKIGYEGPDVRIRRANHHSAYSNANVVTDALQKEVEQGRVRILDTLPNDRYYCSPIGVVPKKSDGVQTGWRVIFDLSCPTGRSVNDNIPQEYGRITYEPLQRAIEMVAKAGKGAIMIKRDLKSAFRHIPVSPEDYWCLIFEWQGKYYADMFLPFGLRTSLRIFNLFSEAVHWVLEHKHGWSITHYLDDFFAVFPPTSDPAKHSATFDKVISEFGLTKAAEKDETGTEVMHLGFEFDSDKMEVRLPPNKLRRAQSEVETLLTRKSISQAKLEEVLGFLSHCCQVVPLGRPFLRQLFSLLQRKTRFRRTRLSSSVKKDLRWWQLFLSGWSSISLIQLSRPTFEVFTDASGLKGIGGIYDNRIFASRVPSRHRPKHINWKEMYAVLHAFILWHKEWAHGSLTIISDNTAVVDGLTNKSIRGPALQPLRTILLTAAVFDIEIKTRWIASEENVIADAASRHDFKKLTNLGFKDQVQKLRNRPTAAIKISSLRRQLYNYFNSRLPQPQGETMSPSGKLTNHFV